MALARRAADGQAIDLDRRLTNANRHALTGFTAYADAGIEGKVVPDHGDLRQHRWSVADQCGILDWCADFSVLNAVRFGAVKDELAAGDVDLPA